VPGGLSYREVNFILDLLVKSNRQIIGFDLCEVGTSNETEWDANVGARVLFRLCQLAQASNK
jgi:Arginase family.